VDSFTNFYILVLWTLYPIVWAVGDGSYKLSVDGEIISYAVLDILAKPVLGLWLLTARAISASSTSLDGFWSHGLNIKGAIRLADEEDV
jgi:bacteriorhodopsin